MKLEKIIQKVAPDLNSWVVRFSYSNMSGETICVTKNVGELYRDWFSNAALCPENGERIFGVEFAYEATCKLFLGEMVPDCDTFEDMMRQIDDECKNYLRQDVSN